MTVRRPLALVGAGAMAVEYSRVLTSIDCPHVVYGRGDASAETFQTATGIMPGTGPLRDQLEAAAPVPDTAIVVVNAMYLCEVTRELAEAGVRRILVEKPAALDQAEMDALLALGATTPVDIWIGYNRRFLASVMKAREFIQEDGGVLSVKFDFSEPSQRIAKINKPQRELDTWFYGNSTHVIDLATHLVGDYVSAHGDIAGSVSWHEAAGVFVGHARSSSGALVSWHANWIGPGRWGVEVVTPERKLILQPLEKLRVQDHASFNEHDVLLDMSADEAFKPGLLNQVQAFLTGVGEQHLVSLAEHARSWPFYEAMRTGSLHTESEV